MNYKKFKEEAVKLLIDEIIVNNEFELKIPSNFEDIGLEEFKQILSINDLPIDFQTKCHKLINDFTKRKYTDMDIKLLLIVWLNLKTRKKPPKGGFSTYDGFFYSDERDLLENNLKNGNTEENPDSEINFVKTLKFVKLLAEKYNCQTLEELEDVSYGECS